MSEWQVVCLRERQLGEHASAWDALNQSAFEDHPLLGSAFVNALLQHWGDGTEHLCTLDRGDGAIAMCLLRRGTMGQWASFLPSQAQLGPSLIRDAAHIGPLLRALPGRATMIDLLSVDPQFTDLGTTCDPTPDVAHDATTMNIALRGSFEAYWASRSPRLRQNLRRYEQRVASDGLILTHVCHSRPAAMASAVGRYAELESKGWKAPGQSALTPGDTQSRFYTQLLERSAVADSAWVHELWMGEQLAASRLIVGTTHMLVSLKITYEESLRRYAPGRLLLKRVIEASFARHPGRTLEFYTRANADQLAWATGHRPILQY